MCKTTEGFGVQTHGRTHPRTHGRNGFSTHPDSKPPRVARGITSQKRWYIEDRDEQYAMVKQQDGTHRGWMQRRYDSVMIMMIPH